MELWNVFIPICRCPGAVSYARTTIIHGYFIAITFAGSLGRYLNTRPSGCSNSFLGTQQMLMHEKPWVIPILVTHTQLGYSKTSMTHSSGLFTVADSNSFFSP